MGSSKSQFYAVNIGNSADDFSRHVIDVLNSYEIEHVHCENIYEATGIISHNLKKNVLVVGKIDELRKEQGRFLDIAMENGAWCCCLSETDCVQEYLNALSTVKTGTYLITQPHEFKEVVDKYVCGSVNSFTESQFDETDFDKNAFTTTEEEINALLSPDFNEFQV